MVPSARRAVVRLVGAVTVAAAGLGAAGRVDTLQPVAAIAAHVANLFTDPVGFAVATNGDYVVLDRRAHAVFRVDANGNQARKIVDIGNESGRVLGPFALSLGTDDIFAVLDQPGQWERIQYFNLEGRYIDGFFLPAQTTPPIRLGDLAMSSASALGLKGQNFVVSRPDWGSLLSELDIHGKTVRNVGLLRETGHESDRPLHLALNAGIPIVDPTGGFYYVFQEGLPAFQKYDADGDLIFERHIEGPELDDLVRALPTVWPRRPDDVMPFPQPLIRTAAADRSGRLWVSLVRPYTYVYDGDGEKVRTVGFQGARPIVPSSLSFSPRGHVLVMPGGYEFDAK